jgi:hypothetical protein
MVVALRPEFREGMTETILDGGLKPDADDMEVIDLPGNNPLARLRLSPYR